MSGDERGEGKKLLKDFLFLPGMALLALGVLAALAIPDFKKMLAKSHNSESKAYLGSIFTKQVAYYGEHGV